MSGRASRPCANGAGFVIRKVPVATMAASHPTLPASSHHLFVAGYSRQGQGMITITSDLASAKRFATKRAAETYLNKYADLGYGLVSSLAAVEAAP